MDLSTMTDDALDQLRRDVLIEQERRQKLEQLPEQVAAMTRDALAAGVPTDTLRAALDDALTPAAEEPTA
ncbi:hypothetical protein M3G50_07290 [Brachybacterium muris]|uniref:hypothetical protein n=1 Tax=Brachybacterium muris TaxID=219301 RepID=UPI0021A29704|nr:hypothetical protein [Brachybacterium muris]MCT1430556.1 hypothetical protein [Brachybacterium muris]